MRSKVRPIREGGIISKIPLDMFWVKILKDDLPVQWIVEKWKDFHETDRVRFLKVVSNSIKNGKDYVKAEKSVCKKLI